MSEDITREASPVGSPAGEAVGAPTTVDALDANSAVGTTTEQVETSPWESEDNPYKYLHQQTNAELAQLRQSQAQQQFQMELGQWQQGLQQQGYTPEQIQQATAMEVQRYQLQQQEEQVNQQSRPIVAHELSNRIKQMYGVDVTPNELLATSQGQPITSVEAMLARADALVQARRQSNYNKRVEKGADKPGDAATTAAIDPAKLKGMRPASKIQLGLRRSGEL